MQMWKLLDNDVRLGLNWSESCIRGVRGIPGLNIGHGWLGPLSCIKYLWETEKYIATLKSLGILSHLSMQYPNKLISDIDSLSHL